SVTPHRCKRTLSTTAISANNKLLSFTRVPCRLFGVRQCQNLSDIDDLCFTVHVTSVGSVAIEVKAFARQGCLSPSIEVIRGHRRPVGRFLHLCSSDSTAQFDQPIPGLNPFTVISRKQGLPIDVLVCETL